ncbi:MAG TPA: tetratricopeptide repeat protein, partial [Puia sp.]|nr:tetratricopeptide repeat protein [Puia sp.]
SAYQGLGNCYYALGRKADALTFYQRASALQPANTQLAQFVQNLQAQVGAGGMATAPASTNYLAQGYSLFQQRQYASSIPYFQYAIQQNPNDYRPYYYAGYAYYMTGNAKSAALYFAIANAKQPNASIKAYADRVKASLSPDDQQWVDDQVAKYTGTAVAAGTSGGGKGGQVAFGFHLLGGMEYIFADPSQIKQYVTAAQSVSLNGATPNIVALPELEPFVQLGDSFEINLAIGYFPVGNLAYTTYEYNPAYPTPPGNTIDAWKYTFDTTIITTDLGIKLLFGDKGAKGYLGLSGGISPISMTFNKEEYDSTGTNPIGQDSSSGTYGALAFNAQALLGVDFSLGKGIAVGPYIGYRYLDATNFQNAGNTLMIDTKTGAVGTAGSKTPAGYSNFPASDPSKALDLDFSGLEGGLNLTFSF